MALWVTVVCMRALAGTIDVVKSDDPFAALRVPPWRFLFTVWPWSSIFYLVCGVVLAFPTVFTIIVFPLLPGWAWALSKIERHRVRSLRLPVIPEPAGARLDWSRSGIGLWLRTPRTWREITNTVLLPIFALVSSPLLLVGLTFIGALFASPIMSALGNPFRIGDWQADDTGSLILLIAIGILLLIAFGYVCALLSGAQAIVTRVLRSDRRSALKRQLGLLADTNVSLIDAFELERQRIERDLHDGPQQHLAGAVMLLGMGKKELEDIHARTGVELQGPLNRVRSAQEQINHSLDTLRFAVTGLRPRVLTELGLVPALEELGKTAPLSVQVTSNLKQRMPAAVEASLYSVATEFLANTIKHAAATKVLINVEKTESGIRYALCDDGTGGADASAGTGLLGIQHRVSLLRGTTLLTSPLSGSTRLEISIPAPAHNGYDA